MLDGMDGTLRRVTPHTCEGTLNGYRVIVSSAGGWHYWIGRNGRGLVCPPAESFADAAAKARAWAEANPLRPA
jgi:hypothetical protein